MQKGITRYKNIETYIEFDKFYSSKKVKELLSLIGENTWKVFYTITSNNASTLGLALIFLLFKVLYQYRIIFE